MIFLGKGSLLSEEVICGSDNFLLDKAVYDEHVSHWNSESIQGFWSGDSWSHPDLGFSLSYNLAHILWRKIESDLSASRDQIVRFVRDADWQDGGEASFQTVFDLSLGALVEDFLGEGDWSPKPHLWPKQDVEDPSRDS